MIIKRRKRNKIVTWKNMMIQKQIKYLFLKYQFL